MTPETRRAPKILIVDDLAENRDLLSRRFVRRGYEVVEAHDGATALQLTSTQSFDLVLLDIMMPIMDGLEVLEKIRAEHSADSLPVVMVTGRSFADDVVAALELGANDYITKPVDFSIAFARVQSQLARKQAQTDLMHSNAKLLETNRELQKQIRERLQSDAQVHFMKNFDSVTGLGNASSLRQTLERALKRNGPKTGNLAVLCVGIDNFKPIRAGLDQSTADSLLKLVAARLLDMVDEPDLVKRVGDDEFAILLNNLANPDDVGRLAEHISEAMTAPFSLLGHDIILQCSAGIALASDTNSNPDVIVQNALLALHEAKSDARNSWRFFEDEMNTHAQKRRMLESDLRKAASAGEFTLHYQPLFNTSANAVSGFEALIRWNHRERGMISPADFIPIAEETGVIVSIGDWVLRQACIDAARQGGNTRVAVNISAIQFQSPGLLLSVMSALAISGLPARLLDLEITESSLIGDIDSTLEILHQLRSLGIRISMDDFGTGYSSLNYLCAFPFDKIKIDQSFIRGRTANGGSKAVVRAIIKMAKELGMTTTAEGVETREQMDWLVEEGCTEIQGYLIGRPMPAERVQSYMMNDQSAWMAA